MTTPFEDAALAALPVFYSLHGEAVTYTRGSTECSVTAIRVQRAVDVESGDGVYSRVQEVDWAFKASDDDFDSVLSAPARGDYITDADGVVYDYAATEARLIDETQEWVIPTQRLNP